MGLAGLPTITMNIEEVETNIVIFKINHPDITASELAAALLGQGIRLLALDGSHLRAIVHMDISDADVHQVVAAVGSYIKHKSVEMMT